MGDDDQLALARDPATIAKAVRDEIAVPTGAYSGDHTTVNNFLKYVQAELNRLPLLTVDHSVFDSYGSGYASFVELCLTKRDGSAREVSADSTTTTYLPLTISRLAPFAALHDLDNRTTRPDGTGGRGLPHLEAVATPPIPGWQEELRQLHQALTHLNITLLDLPTLSTPIAPAHTLQTNLGDHPYRVYDAWFHWMD